MLQGNQFEIDDQIRIVLESCYKTKHNMNAPGTVTCQFNLPGGLKHFCYACGASATFKKWNLRIGHDEELTDHDKKENGFPEDIVPWSLRVDDHVLLHKAFQLLGLIYVLTLIEVVLKDNQYELLVVLSKTLGHLLTPQRKTVSWFRGRGRL